MQHSINVTRVFEKYWTYCCFMCSIISILFYVSIVTDARYVHMFLSIKAPPEIFLCTNRFLLYDKVIP